MYGRNFRSFENIQNIEFTDVFPIQNDEFQTRHVTVQQLYDLLHQPRYDDLRFPATSFNPPGLASDPGLDTTDGTFLFSPTATELLFATVQFPHETVFTVCHPHIHWAKTTSAAGDVVWYYRYKTARIGQVISSYSGYTSATTAVYDDDTALRHLITPLPEIDLEALGFVRSDTLIIEFGRIGGDVLDTYAANAKFLEFDIHTQSTGVGSDTEY